MIQPRRLTSPSLVAGRQAQDQGGAHIYVRATNAPRWQGHLPTASKRSCPLQPTAQERQAPHYGRRKGREKLGTTSTSASLPQSAERLPRLKPGRLSRSASQLWCWAWNNHNWKGSFFFLSASLFFFAASAAACFEPVVSDAAANTGLVLLPYAVGACLYCLGASAYKKAAFEGLAAARRAYSRDHPVCEWARVGVRGCNTIVTGCQLGLVSCWSPLVLGVLPPTVTVAAPVPVPALEAWMTSLLNVAAGALFVVGSYVILGASSRCLAPSRVFAMPNLKDLCFWGSTCYLVGSASMLMGAVLTQRLVPMAPGSPVGAWFGHFFGYVVGSLWFVAGALANIAGIAQEKAALQTAQQ